MRTLSGMGEEGDEKESNTADAAATATASSPSVPVALAAPAPVNKLHEWAAAVVIMAILAAILFGFLFFLRGSWL